ncbi:hypothetical protein [Nostoc sp.]|uniref:hypothetical protein n=1 Tax=Nostoc sp. TaxID=1180 RepID=UPI002FF40521
MARKPRETDLRVGKHIHYWGKNWVIWEVNTTHNTLLLVITGQRPYRWYQPYPSEGMYETSLLVSADDDCLWCFDEIKRDIFGREIK